MVTIRWLREQIRQGKTIYDLPLRVTFYARVSTEKVEQQGSLENQIQYYTEFIQKNPNWTYVPGYIDEGISGTSTYKRDSFLRMIEDAKREMFDFIITKEISRFSRNTLDSIQYVRMLKQMGIAVVFEKEKRCRIWPQTSPMKLLPRSTASCMTSRPAKAQCPICRSNWNRPSRNSTVCWKCPWTSMRILRFWMTG